MLQARCILQRQSTKDRKLRFMGRKKRLVDNLSRYAQLRMSHLQWKRLHGR